MRFLLSLVVVVSLGLPALGQSITIRQQIAPSVAPACQCANGGPCTCAPGTCPCADCPVTVMLAHAPAAYMDEDIAAGIKIMLEQAKLAGDPRRGGNYASMATLAFAAKQTLVVGVECEAPEGPWVTSRATAADALVPGAFIAVKVWDGATLATKGYLNPGATTQQVQALVDGRGQQQVGQQYVTVCGPNGCYQVLSSSLNNGVSYGTGYVTYGSGGCAGGNCGGGVSFGRTVFGGGMFSGGGCAGGVCR